MTSPLLTMPGAVDGSGPDEGVAWHYGDPHAEQRALEARAAFVDQSQLGIVTVTGPDRLSWLDSLCTQAVGALAPGQSSELMILSPQGRIEHVAGAVDDGTTTFLISESAPELATFLDRMRFMLRVEVADATAEWAAIGEPSSLPAAEGEPVTWVDPWPGIAEGGTAYAREVTEWPWRLVLVPRDTLAQAAQERIDAGWAPAGTWALEAIRIAARRPRAVRELDEKSLPHELDWLRTAVHLHKGCYRGQETVAKVHNVGRPPRRLVLLHLDGSEHSIPEPGAAVSLGDKAVGHVTSVSRHHELGPIALALVKRGTDLGETLTVAVEGGEVAASQEEIVPVSGESIDRPEPVGPTQRGLLMGKGCAADGGDMA